MALSKWEYIKDRFTDIEKWLNEGLCQEQIIKNLHISKTTFEKYKQTQPELFELLKMGVKNQVVEVVNCLYKSATGYYYTVEESAKIKGPDGGERLEKIKVQKFKAPEMAAIAFFLKNKDKVNWCDNPQAIDVRREELELRRKESEFGNW